MPKAPRRNPVFPVGVAYWPLDAETEAWGDWYKRPFEEDFDAFDEARLTLVRLFISWKMLEPQVGQYDEHALDRLEELVSGARERKLQVLVTFFADDRLAEMNDVPWGKKRDPRTDQYLVQRQVALVQKVVNRLRNETIIFAWDLANEAFLSGFEDTAALAEWARTMRDAIREVDTERPIIVSADPETLFRANAVDPRAAIDEGEFAVSHVTASYRAYAAEGPITSGPATYIDTFLLRSASRGLPVVLDEVGVQSLDNSPAEEAAYVRTVLYAALMNRAAGVVLRRYRDLDVERREPYFRDPWEVLVGVTDTEGREKPSWNEVKSFVKVAAHVDLKRYTLLPERTAVLIPSERYDPLPNLAGLYDPRSCLQAYISAKEAHVPVTVAREDDELSAYTVLIVPSVFHMSSATWERLAAFVQGGGSLVYSYGGGDADPLVREVFGVEFLGDHGARPALSCRVAQPDMLGPLVSFDAPLEVAHFALLGHGGATVVATDAKGSPLLTLNTYGQGRAAFVAVPMERAFAQGDPWAPPAAAKRMLRSVYGAVARAAGCGAPLACDNPSVEVALLNGESDDILLLLNHAPEKATAGLTFDRPARSIADVRGGKPAPVGDVSFGVPLEPNGTAALRITYE
ncbi:MAG: hypothetical protein FDZ70_04215 [Actinobacteria bacterium]|nr:MAG: hypothetical protein FDZ70_04215 [Actinomycetota bacterium]